ncbi:hypothetical protein SHKM778_11870 [Streptomyces sp. KM77-8]|uniref:Putative restriction endonuclease domain-containing protein n=1 Tax=Streptomyces haneummycinicus TaxID=3074435 RepID=A0AAT9HBN5_9ACTN
MHRRLCEVAPEEWGVHQWWDIAVPRCLGLYVPDLVVVPKDSRDMDNGGLCPAAAAELVVEITSKATASRDRTAKRAGCATGGVPLYLLIDGVAPGGPAFTLHGAPRKGLTESSTRARSVNRSDSPPLRPRDRHHGVPGRLTPMASPPTLRGPMRPGQG